MTQDKRTIPLSVHLENTLNNTLDYQDRLVKAINDLQSFAKDKGLDLPHELDEGLDLFSATDISFGLVAKYINQVVDYAEKVGDPQLTNILKGLCLAKEANEENALCAVRLSGSPSQMGEYLRVDNPVVDLEFNGQKFKAVLNGNIELKKQI